MGFSRYREARDTASVNLIPVMNLFVVMIPFLLLSAAFLHVGVIPASLPSEGTEESGEPDPDAVTMHADLEEGGIRLHATHEALGEEELAALERFLPRRGEVHDHDALTSALHDIKRAYPRSETLVVRPGRSMDWDEVVSVLDAAREITVDEGTTEERELTLFPVVVLSRRS